MPLLLSSTVTFYSNVINTEALANVLLTLRNFKSPIYCKPYRRKFSKYPFSKHLSSLKSLQSISSWGNIIVHIQNNHYKNLKFSKKIFLYAVMQLFKFVITLIFCLNRDLLSLYFTLNQIVEKQGTFYVYSYAQGLLKSLANFCWCKVQKNPNTISIFRCFKSLFQCQADHRTE